MPPCPAPDTCWLYLIRHAATDNNRAVPPVLQGRRTDPGLSAEGLEHSCQTGVALASLPLDAVYTSPLLRARQTANGIAEPHGLEVQILDDLIEVDVGDWEELDWDEIKRQSPEAYQLFHDDASVNPYLGGENLTVVYERAMPAIERLMAANLGRIIAAVAHNVVNRACLARLIGLPLAKYRSIPQDNCGINLLRYRNGHIKVVTINLVEHLDSEQ